MLTVQILSGEFSVCKVRDFNKALLCRPFCFTARTDSEMSLVCRTEDVPEDTVCEEKGWKGLRIAGELDFSLIGILAEIATLLAESKISIFALSTYDTDYIFTKKDRFADAVDVLKANGYHIENTENI